MDLQLFFRVMWRFKALVAIGILAGIFLATLSVARISPSSPYLTYRKPQTFVSFSRLLVTQTGMPWARLGTGTAASADPSRFTGLAVVWSQLATSDEVHRILLRGGPLNGTVDAGAVLDANTQEPLPLISIAAFSATPQAAVSLAQRETRALLTFLDRQQRQNKIAAADRVTLQPVAKPVAAKLYKARSNTLPIVIFLLMTIASIAFAFVLENLRPRAEGAPALVEDTRFAATDAA
jgi:hypothetical protein